MEQDIQNKLRRPFSEKLKELMLGEELLEDLERVYLPLANMIAIGLDTSSTQVIGVNGAQGAGKTSFCTLMKLVLEGGFGLKVLSLSIDDLYMSHSDREKLAKSVHPLFKTRGVPGTHYVQKGIDLLNTLANAAPTDSTPIPRFNKAYDDVYPEKEWDRFVGRPDVILFDGWFMGATEQPLSDLIEPVNDLERLEDPEAVWRTYVNLQLKTEYSRLFDCLNLLVMLQVPSFEKVYEWRALQEKKLRIATKGQTDLRVMNDDEVKRFISHYERLTRWMLKDMPEHVDVLYAVNNDHRICLP
ncbi:MAG: hypothetical protein MJZ23_03105 [Paludibacteraceae bacterium]|nr:hypothetical protein [Paludibacteraceae bacterium]